jgi:ubiquinone/menaquinone biosynthesis C-methylase UbiE
MTAEEGPARPATDYVHGYSGRERERLGDQAATLADLLHHDTAYPPGALVLEAGCGVGAQTAILARRSPGARFVSIDLSQDSLHAARSRVAAGNPKGVALVMGDLRRLPFPDGSFDAVFVCFVLEHLTDPIGALASLRKALRQGGTLTVVEGDHGSAFFQPDSPGARRVIRCLVDSQARLGGDSLIGRRLYPLLAEAGLRDIRVTPLTVHAHDGRPDLVEGFTRNTFTAMVEGAREAALGGGGIEAAEWEAGITELKKTGEPGGTFTYTFFKGTAAR